jgi:hypothetical protein
MPRMRAASPMECHRSKAGDATCVGSGVTAVRISVVMIGRYCANQICGIARVLWLLDPLFSIFETQRRPLPADATGGSVLHDRTITPEKRGSTHEGPCP